MAPIYSHLLYNDHFPTTRQTVYSPPPGYVAVIRTMTCGWGSWTAGDFVEVSWASSGQSRVWVVYPSGEHGSAVWNGRLVLPMGGGIRLYSSHNPDVWCTISGYELQDF